jgi:hypothetical protein
VRSAVVIFHFQAMENPVVLKFIIEPNIPGVSKLTAEQHQKITALSSAVVARSGKPNATIYRVLEADSARAIYRHAEKGGLPADTVTNVETIIGPGDISDP